MSDLRRDQGDLEEPDTEAGDDPGQDPGLDEDEAQKEALTRVRTRFRAGAWLALLAVVGLAVWGALPALDVLALPAFYLLLPALAFAQLPLLAVERIERMPVYLGSIVTIGVIGGVGWLLSRRLEGVAPAGFTALPTSELLAWTAGATAGGILLILISRPVERRVGEGHPDLLRDLLPRTPRERGVFAVLSFSAGVGEEAAYRAYAFQAIQLLGPGPWAAAALSSVPFGFLHAYQGPVGVVRTAAMGFVLAMPVVMTGSLLPSIAAHTLIDLLVGIVLGPKLLANGSNPPPHLVRRDADE